MDSALERLWKACAKGRLLDVEAALADGAKQNVGQGHPTQHGPWWGRSALHLAAGEAGNADCVKALLEARANVEALDWFGSTPLDCAAVKGNLACVVLLLDAGACVTAPMGRIGHSVLHWPAFYGHTECLRTLLLAKAPINASDNRGGTPLHEACRQGRVECALLLLNEKAHIDWADQDGFSPLHLASQAGKPQIVRLLLRAQANIEAGDNHYLTPLALCVQVGKPHDECGKELLFAGAKVSCLSILTEEDVRIPPWVGRICEQLSNCRSACVVTTRLLARHKWVSPDLIPMISSMIWETRRRSEWYNGQRSGAVVVSAVAVDKPNIIDQLVDKDSVKISPSRRQCDIQ